MTRKRFLSALRDYARLARNKRISYAPMVRRMASDLIRTEVGTLLTLAEHDHVREAVRDMVEREYAKFDPEFFWNVDD